MTDLKPAVEFAMKFAGRDAFGHPIAPKNKAVSEPSSPLPSETRQPTAAPGATVQAQAAGSDQSLWRADNEFEALMERWDEEESQRHQAGLLNAASDTPPITTDSATGEKATSDPLDPGPFPLEALSLVARRIAEEVARCHQVPVEMPLLGVLGVLAASVPRKFTLQGGVNGHVSHGNLYVLISAPRSAGKSSIAYPIVRPLIERNDELLRHFNEQRKPQLEAQLAVLEAQAEQALKRVKTASKEEQCIEIHDAEETLRKLGPEITRLKAALAAEPYLWLGNHTCEKLSNILAGNGEQCLIYATEGAEVFRVMAGKYNKDGKANYDIYLSGFSVEPLNVARVGRGSLTITPCLSMLLFVQPVVLKEVLSNKEASERGLFARLIAAEISVKPTRDDGVVREIDPLVQRNWNELIGRLLDERERGQERTLVCTPEAKQVFTEYHNLTCDWREGECSQNEADLGRAREIAIRIALNLALADNPDAKAVTEDIAKRAVAIGRWCLLTTYRLSNKTQREILQSQFERLISLLEKQPNCTKSVRDLKKDHNFSEKLLESLVGLSTGKLEKVTITETGGRPSPVIRLTNPPKA